MSLDRSRYSSRRNLELRVSFTLPDDEQIVESLDLATGKTEAMEHSIKTSKGKGKKISNKRQNPHEKRGSLNSNKSKTVDRLDTVDGSIDGLNKSLDDDTKKHEILVDEEVEEREKLSDHDSDSSVSSEVLSQQPRKKKWTIKLPWKKKNKPRVDHDTVSETSSDSEDEQKDKDKDLSDSNSSCSEKAISKSMDVIAEPKTKKSPEKRAFSWYGFRVNTSLNFDKSARDSFDADNHRLETAKHDDTNITDDKHDVHYSSASDSSEERIFPPSQPYYKKIQKNKGKIKELKGDRRHSNPDLVDKETKEEVPRFEKQLSSSSSSITSVNTDDSIKKKPPKMKKSYSLPTILFRKKKKKKETIGKKAESQRGGMEKSKGLKQRMMVEHDSEPQPSTSRTDYSKRKTFQETPLVYVGSEKPSLRKVQVDNEEHLKREYVNNVETVSSIFKRSSYKRHFKAPTFSTITYPAMPKNGEKIASKDSENLSLEYTDSSKFSSPITQSHDRSKNSTKNSKMDNEIDVKGKEDIIMHASEKGERNIETESRREKISKKGPRPKLVETTAEINDTCKEQNLLPTKENNRHTNIPRKQRKSENMQGKASKRAIDKEEVQKFHLKDIDHNQQVKNLLPVTSKSELAFERALERDLKVANQTVENINNHFGPTLFTRNYRASTASSASSPPVEKSAKKRKTKSKSNNKNKLGKETKKVAEEPEQLIRRLSYEEMLNKLEDEMFDSENWPDEDDSSDTDTDQIDLSFKKPHLGTKVNVEIKKTSSAETHETTTNLSNGNFGSDSEEHVFHVQVFPNKRVNSRNSETKISQPIKKPSDAPPPPPTSEAENVKHSSVLSQNSSFELEKQTYATFNKVSDSTYKRVYDSDSHGYSSSDEAEELDIAKQSKEKGKIPEESMEINNLLNESIAKYASIESPPDFSPPPLIRDSQHSPHPQNEILDCHMARISLSYQKNNTDNIFKNQNDNISATSVANELFERRDQNSALQSQQDPEPKLLAIKNIKSKTSRQGELLSPPPPPENPPPELNPFTQSTVEVHSRQTLKSSAVTKFGLSVSKGPSISYDPLEDLQSFHKTEPLNQHYKAARTLSPTSRNKYIADDEHISSLPVSFDVDCNEYQITSPRLLRAEIVDKRSRNKPTLEVKREYIGPYSVIPTTSSTHLDLKKQAVSFHLPHQENFQNQEQIYANQPLPGTGNSDLDLPPTLPPKPTTASSLQPKLLAVDETKYSAMSANFQDLNVPRNKTHEPFRHSTERIFDDYRPKQYQYNTYPLPYKTSQARRQKWSQVHPSFQNVMPSSLPNEAMSLPQEEVMSRSYSAATDTVNLHNERKTDLKNASGSPTVHSLSQSNVEIAAQRTNNSASVQRPPLKSILRNSSKKTSHASEPTKPVSNEIPPGQMFPNYSLQEVAVNVKKSTDSAQITHYSEADIERVKVNGSSSESSSPPDLPDYPPPVPRSMTEVQQIFMETLLHPYQEIIRKVNQPGNTLSAEIAQHLKPEPTQKHTTTETTQETFFHPKKEFVPNTVLQEPVSYPSHETFMHGYEQPDSKMLYQRTSHLHPQRIYRNQQQEPASEASIPATAAYRVHGTFMYSHEQPDSKTQYQRTAHFQPQRIFLKPQQENVPKTALSEIDFHQPATSSTIIQGTSLYQAQQIAAGVMNQSREHAAFTEPRSRIPYIDSSDSELQTDLYTKKQMPHLATQSHHRQSESYTDPHVVQNRSYLGEEICANIHPDSLSASWNQSHDQYFIEEPLYQNIRLKTDV